MHTVGGGQPLNIFPVTQCQNMECFIWGVERMRCTFELVDEKPAVSLLCDL